MQPFKNPIVTLISNFLNSEGIRVLPQAIEGETFLPGLRFEAGNILLDEEKLLYPGDLLHEAGHLAVTPAEERATMSDTLPRESQLMAGREIAAICWSFAAARFLNLQLEVLFHPNGYRGSSNWLINCFSKGEYIGLPYLAWLGLCREKPDPNDPLAPVYPEMLRWFMP